MSSKHDAEVVKARTDKPELPEKVRHVLEEEGVIKAPVLPNPPMPKIDVLARAGRNEGLGFALRWPEPDPEAEPEDQVAETIDRLVAWTENDHELRKAMGQQELTGL